MGMSQMWRSRGVPTDTRQRSSMRRLRRTTQRREWRNKKLSCRWTIGVSDSNPGFNRKRRSLKKWGAELASALAAIEAAGGTPEQMESRARARLEEDLLVLQGYEEADTPTEFAGLQIEDGERSQHVHVGCAPEPGRPRQRCGGADSDYRR